MKKPKSLKFKVYLIQPVTDTNQYGWVYPVDDNWKILDKDVKWPFGNWEQIGEAFRQAHTQAERYKKKNKE